MDGAIEVENKAAIPDDFADWALNDTDQAEAHENEILLQGFDDPHPPFVPAALTRPTRTMNQVFRYGGDSVVCA